MGVHGFKAALKLLLACQLVGSNCHDSSPCHDMSLSEAKGVAGGLFWVLLGVGVWDL